VLLGQVIERAINVSLYKVLRIAELMFRGRHNNCGNTYSLWGCMTPQYVIKINEIVTHSVTFVHTKVVKPLLIWFSGYFFRGGFCRVLLPCFSPLGLEGGTYVK